MTGTPATPGEELTALLERALASSDPLGALMTLFWTVEDEWTTYDVTRLGQPPGSGKKYQRYLVAKIPRDAVDRRADRSVS
jgi:hypothetical protein